ncbi:PTS mannose/fructose/sorbose transporter subunit IIB [Clostridium tertium]|uniref:Putative phosphotransferase enzyme IIB component n=1 Tax=Clostridium tertium TaxID=1559 RepID=A0A6N3G3Q0_9CLOT
MIKLVRIDDRLLHGQVAFAWTRSLSIETIIIANDAAVKDEFTKMTLSLAKPQGVKLLIKSVGKTIDYLNDDSKCNKNIMVIINCVADAFRLHEGVSKIDSINFGGIKKKDGAEQVSNAISLKNDEKELCKKMINDGIELEVRQVPAEGKQLINNLI